jgi:TonB-dependent starch-binding outer membrane protein SusC
MKEIHLSEKTIPEIVRSKIILKVFLIITASAIFILSGTNAYSKVVAADEKGAADYFASGINGDGKSISNMQQVKITGTVTDETGNPLPGVNIMVEGTTTGTISDQNGKYSLDVPGRNAVILYTFVGYVTQKITVGAQTTISVSMAPDVTALNEVVVVGYGTIKKASMTGSVIAVKGEAIQIAPAPNLTNTLAGRLPGLVAVNYSGEPGRDDATIRIRGSNTLGNNSPLVVIDGVANRDMTRIDPNVIESITVLKDASAAIYGAQAANGVILITTKRGAIGKPEITVNMNYALTMPTIVPKMCSASQYAEMLNDIDSYTGQPSTYSQEEIQKFRDGSSPWLYPNVDYFKEVFKKTSTQNNGNVSVRGGSENMKYFISSGFNYQDAIYRNSAADYSQVDFRSNIDGKITKNISLGVDLAGRQENRNHPYFTTDYIFGSLITGGAGSGGRPTQIAWYPGNLPASGFIGGMNPVVMGTNIPGYNNEKYYRFQSNVRLLVTIPWVKGLSVTGNVSFDKDIYNGKTWAIPYNLYTWDRKTYDSNNLPVVTPSLSGGSLDPQLTQNMSDGQSVMLNGLVNYDLSIAGKHNIKVLAGVEKITGKSMNLMAFRRGFVSTVVDQMFAGADPAKNNGGSASQSARLNYFGRVNYDFMQKYLLEFVWRYDGSYIFPDEGRFGFFPGISAGWKISEEGFWKNTIRFINYFKLRGSWGQTGNDRIDAYQYLSSYGFGSTPYVFNQGVEAKVLNELRIPNPNVTWEVANQSNVGFDGQLFNGRIDFSAEYFYNLRTNILWYRNASVPVSTGLTLPRENIGKVENQGFEVQLGTNGKFSSFNYSASLNIAYAKNKILFWDETPGIPEYQKSTGRPMNAGLYYNAIGIFRDQAAVDAYPHWAKARPGDIIFEDVNMDNKIDGLDQVRFTKSDIPRWTGGLSIDLGYKNFFASLLLQGSAGAVRSYNIESGKIGNFLYDDYNGRWTADNPNATKPRTWNAAGEYWSSINNTYWLKSNDYLRLKNLQIGYNIPKTICDKLRINTLSIFFTGLNLITFAPEKTFDPETVGNRYPLNKVYNMGVKLTF